MKNGSNFGELSIYVSDLIIRVLINDNFNFENIANYQLLEIFHRVLSFLIGKPIVDVQFFF